jgi:hypothetical protein
MHLPTKPLYTKLTENEKNMPLTSLSFIANIIALACSAALPTIGSRMTLINAIGMLIDSDAP